MDAGAEEGARVRVDDVARDARERLAERVESKRRSPESDGEYPAAALAALEARNAVDRAVYERAVRAFEAVLRRRARRRGGRGGVL